MSKWSYWLLFATAIITTGAVGVSRIVWPPNRTTPNHDSDKIIIIAVRSVAHREEDLRILLRDPWLGEKWITTA